MNENRNIERPIDKIADELLIHRSQEGSKQALEALLTRWQEPLWRHAVRMTRDSSLADDVLQESLIAIVRQIRNLNDPARFRSWAYRIVTFKAADQIRSRQRSRKIESAVSEKAEELESDEPALDKPVDLLRAAMQRLNENDRLILTLFYLEEMKISEVANICSIPLGTVKSRLFKARSSLKKILDIKFNPNNQNHE